MKKILAYAVVDQNGNLVGRPYQLRRSVSALLNRYNKWNSQGNTFRIVELIEN
mgnify:CR=1 FL=1